MPIPLLVAARIAACVGHVAGAIAAGAPRACWGLCPNFFACFALAGLFRFFVRVALGISYWMAAVELHSSVLAALAAWSVRDCVRITREWAGEKETAHVPRYSTYAGILFSGILLYIGVKNPGDGNWLATIGFAAPLQVLGCISWGLRAERAASQRCMTFSSGHAMVYAAMFLACGLDTLSATVSVGAGSWPWDTLVGLTSRVAAGLIVAQTGLMLRTARLYTQARVESRGRALPPPAWRLAA